jgi:hypothetical protein
LPFGAVFVGGGWVFNGVHVGVDFDFGLGVNFFTFVACDHFWEHDYRAWIVPHDRVALIFRHSLIENHFRRDEHGRFFNEGLGRDRMAALTHHEVRAVALHDLRERDEHRDALVRRDDIHNFRPGSRPNAMRTAETRAGAREGAERDHGMTPGRDQNREMPERNQNREMAPGREQNLHGSDVDRGNQEREGNKGYPGGPNNNTRDKENATKYQNQKGQPQNGEKGSGNDSKNNKDRNGN